MTQFTDVYMHHTVSTRQIDGALIFEVTLGHYPIDPYTSSFKVMAKVKPDGHICGVKFN